MERVKDPLNLARAFVRLTQMVPEIRDRLRLVMVGDGTVKPEVVACIEQAGLLEQAWLPGALNNVHEIMRGLDVFVLPSLAEGISNTILEAMASGLPVVATRTGGNPELVEDGETGTLVPPGDPDALADGMLTYVRQEAVRLQHGRRARQVALERFSLASMVERYAALYRRFAPARSSATRVGPGSDSIGPPRAEPNAFRSEPRERVEPINHPH
jgi:glycosyltransferase involved in cell wall biosynthesis